MSDETNPEATTDTSQETKESSGLTLDQVREEISKVVGNLFDSGKATVSEKKSTAKKDDAVGTSVADQVKTELERLRSAEKEEENKKAILSENDRLKNLVEGTPVEKKRSKMTDWLWGTE